jgi:hypothetical protein
VAFISARSPVPHAEPYLYPLEMSVRTALRPSCAIDPVNHAGKPRLNQGAVLILRSGILRLWY